MIYICDSFDYLPRILGREREFATLTIKPVALNTVRESIRTSEVDFYIRNKTISGYFTELLGCRAHAGNEIQPLAKYDGLIIGIYHDDQVRWWHVSLDE